MKIENLIEDRVSLQERPLVNLLRLYNREYQISLNFIDTAPHLSTDHERRSLWVFQALVSLYLYSDQVLPLTHATPYAPIITQQRSPALPQAPGHPLSPALLHPPKIISLTSSPSHPQEICRNSPPRD